MKKTIMSWSTGKDAALAFYFLQKNDAYMVSHLLTTVNTHFDRVTMHGLRREFLEKQIAAIGLPHTCVELPESPDMGEYEQQMNTALRHLQASGHTQVAYGDIFLEDLRQYREKELKKLDMQAHFPLWGMNTTEILREFIRLKFRAIVVCINAAKLDASFIGREIDEQFLADLPTSVDPCGENGEFHTFCFDGPIFQHPIAFVKGEITRKTYKITGADGEIQQHDYLFCDLIPQS